MGTSRERRLYARQTVQRPCKVFRRNTQRYVAAQTHDVSAGGALLELETPRPVTPGEKIDVGVAWSRSPVLLEDALMEARVIRVTPLGESRQRVAVRFESVHELAAVA